MELAVLTGVPEGIDDAGSGSFFLHLLANEAPEEVLGGLVILCRSQIDELIYEFGYVALVVVNSLKNFAAALTYEKNIDKYSHSCFSSALD